MLHPEGFRWVQLYTLVSSQGIQVILGNLPSTHITNGWCVIKNSFLGNFTCK